MATGDRTPLLVAAALVGLTLLARRPSAPGVVLGATPGILPGTMLPPGAATVPVVHGGGAGTANPHPVVITSPASASVLAPAPAGWLSAAQIAKIAASALKVAAAFFRHIQHDALNPSGAVTLELDAETQAAWAAYRAGEWHVELDGVLIVDDVTAPVLNAEFATLSAPVVRDVPLLVPSDFMLLNDHVAVSGLAPGWTGVDLSLAFTADTTQEMIGQMAHEEMRAYIDALPEDQALQFVDDAAGLTGYTRLNVLDGLQALGLLAGTLAIAKGATEGSPISILGGITAVISNFGVVAKASHLAFGTPLLNGSVAAGLGVLSGILGIAAGLQGDNIFGVISGTIGVITGVVNLASSAALVSSTAALLGTTVIELAAAAAQVLAVLSVVTVVLVVVGFMISNDLAQAANQYAAEAHEFRTIQKDMQVAWPQLVSGHKAAILLQFVSVLPSRRHVEALRAIFHTCHVGIGAGAAISKFLGAAGAGEFQTGDVSQFEAVSGIYSADCVIGTMRTQDALLRLGVQTEPGFYPLGIVRWPWLLFRIATGTKAWGTVTDADGTSAVVPGPYGDMGLLDAIVPPLLVPVCVEVGEEWQSVNGMSTPVQVCARTDMLPDPGSGFAAAVWGGNQDAMIMRVVAYYNPQWPDTLFGRRLQFLGTYPVPLSAALEATEKLQYEYWAAINDAGGVVPDPWYNPRFVVPTSWPAFSPVSVVDPPFMLTG